MSYIKQLEKDKFAKTVSGLTAIRVKIVAAGVTGIPNQNSRADREKAKFDTWSNGGAVCVKIILTT
jgi:hypothetical protein